MSLRPSEDRCSSLPLGGLWPALLTPLDPAGQPAWDVLEHLVELYIAQRLDGLYVGGSTGQWPLLTVPERETLAERVIRTAAGRIPVMVHVGATSTADAVRLARHAASVGAQAVSTVAPTYYPHSADVVFEYYRAVGQAAESPLYVYHLSMVNQLRLPPEDYVARLLSLPRIAGMKITDLDLNLFGLIRAHAGDRLRLFSGADEVLCHAVLSGSVGAIGSFYNLWGPACRQARDAMVRGDVAAATDFTRRFQLAISRILGSGSLWSFLRAAMLRRYRLDIGMPRPPLGTLSRTWDDRQVAELLALVDPEAA
jgi:N-acetylneuraminate lyase